MANGEQIHSEVAAKLGDNHPLLTRAVLVKRLLDVAAEATDRSRLLANIQSNPNDYFRQFVGSIITREAREKWIDKVGEVAQPLISEEDHYELLAMIALEMWSNGTEALRGDVLDFVSEMFADAKRKDKVVTHQIIERVKQHALLVQADGGRFAFDHEEFYHFFLGLAVGRLLVQHDKSAISHAFRQGVLPTLSIEAATNHVRLHRVGAPALVNTVNEVCLAEPRASFIKENLGGIVARLLDYTENTEVSVRHGSFPPESLAGRHYADIEFQDCYFQSTSLAQARFVRCRFVRCEFELLELRQGLQVQETALVDCNCRAVIPMGSETAVFAPQQVAHALTQAGFSFPTRPEGTQVEAREPEEHVVIVERMLRAFMRATGVNEHTLQKRLGSQANQFFKDVLPALQKAGIVTEVTFKGAGAPQRRFRLAVPLERVNHAMEECDGQFERLLDLASRAS